jgi:DGQHR domain-containing protein
LNFNCITFKQGDTSLAVFVASAKRLWQIVDINRKVEDKDEGYQRVLSAARAKKIARFIEEGNILPTSVLVSFDTAKLTQKGTKLTVPNRPNAGWVIDGQHRLAGAHQSKKDIRLPVVAFMNLDIQDQINCFVTINREQKGVPTSLYLDLLKFLPGKRTEAEVTKERAAGIGTELKRDESSLFFDKIVITTSPKQGELSLTNFVRKVAPLIKRDGRLATFTMEECKDIIDNYFTAISHVFPKEFKRIDSVFFRTIGFGALMNVLPTFLDLTIKHHHAFRVADAVKVFKEVEDFNFREWSRLGTGAQAEKSAAEDLRVTLRERLASKTGESEIRLR